MRNGSGNGGAVLAPRMTVRHGAAGLLAAEAVLVLAWALLWATFLVALTPATPRRLVGAAGPPGPAPVEARAAQAGEGWRG